MVVEVVLEVRSTTGFTADCGIGAVAGAGARGAAAGVVLVVAGLGAEICGVVRLTIWVTGLAGLAGAVCVTCLTVLEVRLADVVAAVPVSDGAEVESVTAGAGAVESAAGGVEVAAGGVVVAAGGAVSDGTGWVCCASSGVEESARAAAIAGRALARRCRRLFLIMGNNRRV